MIYDKIETPHGEIEVVRVGNFTIFPFLGSIYIEHPDGSGLTVDDDVLINALQRVYDENF